MCLPSQKAFRPPRITYKPAILGPQTAVVVGPQGEKCYMDDKGRAKVKFHWDRAKVDDDKRTCWLRVAYPYAGSDHGFQFHPLVDDEVVVTFLEGDPDKPLITGVVYNGKNCPPLKPEDRIENVILTPYQHRLMFSDREATITLNTGGGKDVGPESLTMYDGDSKYGNAIYLRQANGHHIYLAKNSGQSAIFLATEEEHNIVLQDSPASAILLRDKTKNLTIKLDSDNETIVIENETPNKIIIKCQQGNVSVIGGSVDVTGGQVNINGSQSVSIKSDAKVSIEAPVIQAQAGVSISLTAPIIKLDAPMVIASGAVNVGIGIVSPSYSPGVGNLV
jgi:phage baseplate assembly protein gpV